MTLESGDDQGRLMLPCPLCAQVYRELGLHPANLGPGATGGILAPLDPAGSGEERTVARVRGRDRADITVRRGEAELSDPAIAEAIRNAASHGHPVIACVELTALHALAIQVRAELASALSNRPS
jgi:hypothetical protein